ncbi:MAG: L-threonylcarbamoyladenylate synthase [Anaerolineales bacterium]|nr:L-threonylcarbamoyladenylate synthase [Anaerolineales bacterium]
MGRIVRTDAQGMEAARRVLAKGGLVAFPTDTVYGLGADLHNEAAIERIYQVKQRPKDKAIPVLLAGPDQLDEAARPPGDLAARLANRFWPGPLTLVLPRQSGLPANLGPGDSVGVRVPDHEFALLLLRDLGPLAVTSANRSGGEDTRTAQAVYDQIGERVELILDGGRTPGGEPSTVVDCRGGEIKILRRGPISEAELRDALE